MNTKIILILRILLGLAVPVLVLSEAVIDGPWGSGERRWTDLLLPYLPLWGIAVGPRIGLAVWVSCLMGLGLTAAPVAAVASTIVPSILVVAVCCYLFPRQAALWTAIGAIIVAFFLPVLFFDNGMQAGGVLASMTALGATGGLTLNMYRYRTDAQETQIEELHEKHAQVRREERHRLGHELHDIVAHDVTVIAMQARRTRFIEDPEKVRDVVEKIGSTAQQTLHDLRSMVSLLRAETGEEEGAGQSLLAHRSSAAEETDMSTTAMRGETVSAAGFIAEAHRIEESLRNAGFVVHLSLNGEMERIPSSLLPSLKRSIRELGTNILKHADVAQPVTLLLELTDTELVLCTSNTISATPPITSSGAGLAAMQTRSSVFGGALESAAEGRTWTTRMVLPLRRVGNDPTDTTSTENDRMHP